MTGMGGADFEIVRKSVTTRLREYCEAKGLTFETDTRGGVLCVVINGEEMTPGQAAQRYLT